MREEIKARSWAWSGNHLKVYPVPTQDHYNTKGSTGRKISLPYVKLVIEIGNAKHEGKEIYKQNSNELRQTRSICIITEREMIVEGKTIYANGYRKAKVGVTVDGRIVYSREAMVAIHIEEGMAYEDAVDYLEYNVFNSYVGEYTPLYISTDISEEWESDC